MEEIHYWPYMGVRLCSCVHNEKKHWTKIIFMEGHHWGNSKLLKYCCTISAWKKNWVFHRRQKRHCTVHQHQDLIPTLKHGESGSILVWECFAPSATGQLAVVDGGKWNQHCIKKCLSVKAGWLCWISEHIWSDIHAEIQEIPMTVFTCVYLPLHLRWKLSGVCHGVLNLTKPWDSFAWNMSSRSD